MLKCSWFNLWLPSYLRVASFCVHQFMIFFFSAARTEAVNEAHIASKNTALTSAEMRLGQYFSTALLRQASFAVCRAHFDDF